MPRLYVEDGGTHPLHVTVRPATVEDFSDQDIERVAQAIKAKKHIAHNKYEAQARAAVAALLETGDEYEHRLLDATCKAKSYCCGRGTYTLEGVCSNCGQSYYVMQTKGHDYHTFDCLVCECKAVKLLNPRTLVAHDE